jgi:D-alanine-D-alanine ligase
VTKVAVVRGGRSLERKYSLLSGHHVAASLRKLGHDVTEVDVDDQLTRALEASDIAFITLHGRDGEDGTIQLICEALGLPYTGSRPRTCHHCFDKGLAKGVLDDAGVPVSSGFLLSAEAVRRMGAGAALRRAAQRIGYPLVVKPAAQGSALGLVVAQRPEDLSAAVMEAFNYGDRVLLEAFVPGAELSVGVIGGPDPEALPPVEIRTASGVFDILARESPGAVDFLCPASVPAGDIETAQQLAREAARVLAVRDFGRVDIRFGADGPVVLDVKTCPGLTETSIVPLAAGEARIPFEDFAGRVLDAALARAAPAGV